MGRTGVLTLRPLRLHREGAARRQRLQAGGTQPRIPKPSDPPASGAVGSVSAAGEAGAVTTPPRGALSHPRPRRCRLSSGSCGHAHPERAPASWGRPGPWASPPARAPQQGPPGLPGAVSALSLGSTHSAESSRGTGTWGAGQSRLTTGLPAEPLCPRPATSSQGSYQPSPATDSARSQALPPCIATPSRGQTPNPLSPSQSKQVGTARQGPASAPWGWPALNAAGPGEEPCLCLCDPGVPPRVPSLPWAAAGAGLSFLCLGWGRPEGTAQRRPGHGETGIGGEQPEPSPGRGQSRAPLT